MAAQAAGLLLALCAGAVGASSPVTAPADPAWKADADDQFLLDVNIRQLRLGDGVRAYNDARRHLCCLRRLFDDPRCADAHRSDVQKGRAAGRFKEDNRISIDYGAGTATYGGKTEALSRGAIRETPEGWCVQAAALGRWFGIGVKPVTTGSVLLLQSEAKLPVELAVERKKARGAYPKARFDLSSLPRLTCPIGCGGRRLSISSLPPA